jgi:hypothetical protein
MGMELIYLETVIAFKDNTNWENQKDLVNIDGVMEVSILVISRMG